MKIVEQDTYDLENIFYPEFSIVIPAFILEDDTSFHIVYILF